MNKVLIALVIALTFTSCGTVQDVTTIEKRILVRDTVTNQVIDTIYQTETEVKEITRWRTKYKYKESKDSIKYVYKTNKQEVKAYQDSLKQARKIKVSENKEERKKAKSNWYIWLLIGFVVGVFVGWRVFYISS